MTQNTPYINTPAVQLWNGDALEILKQMPDNSVDHIICDPPYELGFARNAAAGNWDKTGIAFNVELWTEALRVIKPGGNLLAAGATRTYHRLAVAIEDAGFEIRDSINWIYAQGMPKSLELAKSLTKSGHPELAEQYQGWETQLKPSFEPWVVARKPMSTSLTQNIIDWGVGGLNIDAVRIPTDESTARRNGDTEASTWKIERTTEWSTGHTGGRWPTNTVFTHSEDCIEDGACDAQCPVAALSAHARQTDPARFFPAFRYESKARGKERPQKGSKEEHATIKPLKLMDFLVQLVAAPGQTVLDIFAGSGTTMEACIDNNVNTIGIELEEAHLASIEERLERAFARKAVAA